MTDVMEQHDHKNFEIFAYYCGINRPDSTQERIKKGVDHWTDINGLSDDDAAAKIAADGIDILVDLNGYTKDARTKVFRTQARADHRELVRLSQFDGNAVPSLSDRG